jgi:hypothetical protein
MLSLACTAHFADSAGANIEATLAVAFSISAPLREAAMTQTTHPTKQLIRDYLDDRTRSDDPPPSADEIRLQLGWHLLPASRQPSEIVAD